MTNAFLKKTSLLFTVLAVLIVFQACGPFGVRATGDDMTRTFDETDFHGLDLSVSASVEVRIDSVYRVEITCEETAMPYVETRVSNGVLKIYFERNVYDVDNMKIIVSAPSWDYFDVSGSGKIEIPDPISGDELHLDISGSGDVYAADASFDRADFEISGSGDLEVNGIADDMHARISGSGTMDCLDFPVKTAHLEVSGSGKMKVQVLETLDAEVSGSGDIFYEGNPTVNVHVSGSGKVKKL